jgi:hypothetical protein
VNIDHASLTSKVNRNNLLFIDTELVGYFLGSLISINFAGRSPEKNLYLTSVQQRVPAIL